MIKNAYDKPNYCKTINLLAVISNQNKITIYIFFRHERNLKLTERYNFIDYFFRLTLSTFLIDDFLKKNTLISSLNRATSKSPCLRTYIDNFTFDNISHTIDSLYFKSSSTSGLSRENGFRFSTIGVWSGSTRMRILLVSRERGSVRGRSSLYEAAADKGDAYGT